MDRRTAQRALQEARVEIAPDDHRPYEAIIIALAEVGIHIPIPEGLQEANATLLPTNEGTIQ